MATPEDRIRNLCAQAAAADDEALNAIIPQLKDALREYLKNLRLRVAEHRFHTEVAAN